MLPEADWLPHAGAQVFALASECAAMGSYNVLPEDCLDLWALAASLQVRDERDMKVEHNNVLQ